MRYLRPVLFLAAMFLLALVARSSSTGSAVIGTGREYLGLLASGDTVNARALLTDSLAGLLAHRALEGVDGSPDPGGFSVGRMEPRGLPVSVPLPEGGSRTLWLRRSPSGGWRVSGDSSLDNVLGNATVLCSSFARSTVVPAVSAGLDAADFSCPVSGLPYRLEEGRLVCPAGHLGNGMETGGAGCSALRDSLAGMVRDYIGEGHSYPATFREMYDESMGEYGQRGGYHCPDNGYSYYTITDEGIFCPYHGGTTPVLSTSDPVSPADAPSTTNHSATEDSTERE
ncbi:MAG: hypothetical protein AVO35_02035 [Candidatus Aegiribacteria sp. MLS_C]|nr:MAG: hypothetical protein AVO35_02035 [Candidatus Aegiribacteria sp. MLS_C]